MHELIRDLGERGGLSEEEAKAAAEVSPRTSGTRTSARRSLPPRWQRPSRQLGDRADLVSACG